MIVSIQLLSWRTVAKTTRKATVAAGNSIFTYGLLLADDVDEPRLETWKSDVIAQGVWL